MKNENFSVFELTTKTDKNYGYEDYPFFNDDIWPIFNKNLTYFENIYLFENNYSKSIAKHFDSSKPFIKSFFKLTGLNNLSKKAVNQLYNFSYYGGCLNVFYEFQNDTFLAKLINMWSHRKIRDLDYLKLNEIDANNLVNFLEHVCPKGTIMGSFNHDVDTLYLFGYKNVIKGLYEKFREGKSEGDLHV